MGYVEFIAAVEQATEDHIKHVPEKSESLNMLEQIVETTFDEMIIEYIPIVFGGTLLLGLTWVFGYWFEKIT